jgi:hypothetical protein
MDYSHGRYNTSNLLNRPLRELPGLAPTTVPTDLFSIKPFGSQMKLLRNLFQAPLERETTQNKYISVCQCF